MAFVEKDRDPAVIKVCFNGIFATGESRNNALDICSGGDIAGKYVELIIFFRYERFQSVRLSAEFQCFDEFFHSYLVFSFDSTSTLEATTSYNVLLSPDESM